MLGRKGWWPSHQLITFEGRRKVCQEALPVTVLSWWPVLGWLPGNTSSSCQLAAPAELPFRVDHWEGLALCGCHSGRKVPWTEPFVRTSEQSLKVTAADQVGGMLAPTKQLQDTSLLIGNRLKHQLRHIHRLPPAARETPCPAARRGKVAIKMPLYNSQVCVQNDLQSPFPQ